MNNLLARYFMQWARVYKNSKMNYENKYIGNVPSIATFTMFPAHI